ncbi:MAG TPA: hypothetical protein VFV38_19250 [Ktedonobacteraceae bacterium]|nr:hypothetical protein [Ktedonobacteraceae bacterium]
MKLKIPNPMVLMNQGIHHMLNRVAPIQEETPEPLLQTVSPAATLPSVSVEPVHDQGKDAVPVSPHEASQAIADIDRREQDARTLAIVTAAAEKTERFRKEAESFDDEKAPLGEKGLRVLFSAFAYLVPIALAYFIGQAVGDAFTPAGSTDGYSQYAHFLSIALEMSMPILGFCVSLTFRRAAKDRSQVALCSVFFVLFLGIGLGNAVVQIFMVTQSLGALNERDQSAVLFRAASPLIIDLICTLYLSVTGAKSLRRYLADKRAVIEAVRDIAGINVLLESQQQTAAINQMTAMMDMQSKQQRAVTWNRLEALQAQSMIKNAEKAMRGENDDDTGAYRRRRY